jgi:hypothetical protein
MEKFFFEVELELKLSQASKVRISLFLVPDPTDGLNKVANIWEFL